MAEASIDGTAQLEEPALLRRTNLRRAFELVIVAICTIAFVLNISGLLTTLLTARYAGERDFVAYWASARQLVNRANPYERSGVGERERSVGYPRDAPVLIMRNAPTALPLIFPLGFFDIRAASLFWTLLMLVAFWVSVRELREMYQQKGAEESLLAISFAPAIACLIAGQTTMFVLLGLVLFLRFHQTKPWIAGTSLWLCALKPQIFLLFVIALIVWILRTRSYKIAFGAAFALLISCAITWGLDPTAWTEYGRMMRGAQLDTVFIPCVSTVVRLMIKPNVIWLQFLPAALGCIWTVYYLQRNRRWDWYSHGSLLMLVSVLVAPYSWFVDQAVLLVPVMHALSRNTSRLFIAVLVLLSAAIELANFRGVPLRDPTIYPWTAVIWLAWYIGTCSFSKRRLPQHNKASSASSSGQKAAVWTTYEAGR